MQNSDVEVRLVRREGDFETYVRIIEGFIVLAHQIYLEYDPWGRTDRHIVRVWQAGLGTVYPA